MIDLDRFQGDCTAHLLRWLDYIISRTIALPHLLNLSRQAENAIDEMQESAFALLSSLFYAGQSQKAIREAVESRVRSILERFMAFVTNATYKCERPSGENASECLSLLVDLD